MARDQRYCLECGERAARMSSVLAAGPPAGPRSGAPPTAPPGAAPPAAGDGNRSGTIAVLAGIGVLLLAMGVGVLIGRAGAGGGRAAPAQVVTVAGTGASTGAGTGEAAFSADWPSGTNGYTVQLQTLPTAGTTVAAVGAAKTAAGAKGAKDVGALRSGDYSSLTAGNYVIYSGVFHKRAEAQKALGGLRKSFPGASVISVSDASAGTPAAGGGKGSGSDIKHPAPPSVLEGPKGSSGKSYEEKSKNLPNVISTG
jgi:hypothetical protein